MQWLFAGKNIYQNQFIGEMDCAEGKIISVYDRNEFSKLPSLIFLEINLKKFQN
jgi:hypothetical protein